jgi:CRISPR-associated Csx10 family RAMP protein
MELSVQECEPEQVDVQAWSQAWKGYYTKATGQEPALDTYFSVTLTSPAVLVDRFLRPSAELNLDFPDLTLVGKVAKMTTVRGWQAAWGLPKPDDMALAAGSVFLFRYQGQDVSGLNVYLTQVARYGIGLRRQEGLGAVSICDSVHHKEGI